MAALPLKGKKVAVTGRLATLSHSEFAVFVQAHGATFQTMPTRSTSVLVLGQLSDEVANAVPPQSLVLAQRYRAAGYPIALCSEEEFLTAIDADGRQGIHGRFTARQLSRILAVPEPRLRSWARAGLIEPVEIIHRLAWFDYHETTQAKRLCELLDSGASVQDVRRNLQAMAAWLGSPERLLARLSLISRRRLVVRMEDGQLVEATGQLLMDFDGDPPAEPLSFEVPCQATVDDWFNLAVDAEDAGDHARACEAYRRAIALDSVDPVLQFNLGNVLYELGETSAAATAYQTAVRLDPCYAEAWNNLGNVLAELGESRDAVAAFDRAIALVPGYPDAKHNRAHALEVRG